MSNVHYLTAKNATQAVEQAQTIISNMTDISWAVVSVCSKVRRCDCKCNCGETIGFSVELDGQTVYAAVCEVCGEE